MKRPDFVTIGENVITEKEALLTRLHEAEKMESGITLDSLFSGKLLVTFFYQGGLETGTESAICLARDAGGILLQLEKGSVVYYPWHRIERILPDTVA